jgi:hypothetical protein
VILALDLDFQLILLLVAGAVWVLGKAAERIKQIRDLTGGQMRKRREQREVEWTSSDEGHDSVLRETREALERATEERPPRRPPRQRPPAPFSPVIPVRTAPAFVRHRRAPGLRIGLLRGDRARLKEAIVLREVLGPPVALRRGRN